MAVTPALLELTDPSYLAELTSQDLETVRTKRQQCQDLENAYSYARRLLHGRLDIVRSELERRNAGDEPADLETIIARLPDLLSDGTRSDSLPRPPQDLAPDTAADSLVADLDHQFPPSRMAELPTLSIAELADLGEALSEHERELSEGRQALHGVIDSLHEEIIRRYQAGDASVETLLR